MSVVGAVGLAISAVGTGISYAAKQKQIAEQTNASKKAENAREQQMRLEAANRRRQAVREAIVARGMALAGGTAQGAQYGSGVFAATGQAVAQGAENQQISSASETIGGRVFQANREYFDATQRGQAGQALGEAIGGFGSMIASNAGKINSLGDYFSNRPQNSTLNRGFSG